MVPPGVSSGHTYILGGKGAYDFAANKYGDLHVVFLHQQSEHFVITKDNDVIFKIDIGLDDVLCGDLDVEIDLGKEKLFIRSNGYFDPSKSLRIHGMGLPIARGLGQGDMIVHFNVIYPPNLLRYRPTFSKMFQPRPKPRPLSSDDIVVNIPVHGK
jgi:DnaJ-class molecular chaperone